jgi:hypothetical protein
MKRVLGVEYSHVRLPLGVPSGAARLAQDAGCREQSRNDGHRNQHSHAREVSTNVSERFVNHDLFGGQGYRAVHRSVDRMSRAQRLGLHQLCCHKAVKSFAQL